MKKLLCLSVLLLFPAISHAQSRPMGGGSAPSSTANGGSGGAGGIGGASGGGSGSSASVSPAINRNHGNATGVRAFRNDGSFELTEVLPWKQAVDLGQPKPEKDLATVARESREQAARETVPARATLVN